MRITVAMPLLLALAASARAAEKDGRFDPAARWQAAEKEREAVLRALEAARKLRSDYEAVARLARDGDLRARSFQRLAELDAALGHPKAARGNLLNALRAAPKPRTQRRILLALGDVLARRLHEPAQAAKVYQQLVAQYPDTPEAELAKLRSEGLPK
jgi:hypothetical protein